MEEKANEQLDVSKKALEKNNEGLEAAKTREKAANTQFEKARQESEQTMKAEIGRLERDKEYAPEASQQGFKEKTDAARKVHDNKMQAEKANIERAQAEVARIQILGKTHEESIMSAQKTLADIAEENKVFNEKMKTVALDNVSADKIAGKLVPARLTNILGRALGRDASNDRLTALTRKQIKESGDEKAIKKILKKQVEESEKAEKKEEGGEDSGNH